ncbi:MAG TPA: hypothetical protein VMS11_03235 [Solirubrobacterales bacterium]|nr:hypothetical protein [Solirubrobacterales bacterium]
MPGRAFSIAVLAAALALFAAAPAVAAPAVNGEFTVPEIEANDKIVAGPDGNMWLTVSEAGKDVAKVTPTGVVTPYDVGAITAAGIAVGPEGWTGLLATGGRRGSTR